MTGKYDLCKHEGPMIKHGKKLNRLYLCSECNQAVIKNILDVVAYLQKPRVLESGRVKSKSFFSWDSKVDFIIENARIINRRALRLEGRPRKEKEDLEKHFDYKEGEGLKEDKDETFRKEDEAKKFREPSHSFKGMPGRSTSMLCKWSVEADEKSRKMISYLFQLYHKNGVFCLPTFEVVLLFARVNIFLPTKILDAINDYFLIKQGFPLKEKANPRLTREWGVRCERLLKTIKAYPNIAIPPPAIGAYQLYGKAIYKLKDGRLVKTGL
jgi:hypothetical protein